MTGKKLQKNKNSRNILVTGGGGFLGGAIIKQLLKTPDRIYSFSRGIYPKLASKGVRHIQGDIRHADVVEKVLNGMDIVFHVAAKPGVWGGYSEYYDINVMGTRNIISACIKNQVSYLIYTSSPSVVFNGNDMEDVDESVGYAHHFHSHYQKTKAIAEQEVIAASKHLKTITLRPHLIWGPGDNHLVPRIVKRAKRLVRIGDGKNLVDTTYIENAATAHILAAKKLEENSRLSGRVYFISQGQPIPLWGMVNSILKAADLSPVKRSVSPKTACFIGMIMEGLYKTLQLKKEPIMTRFVAKELSTSHWFNISAAKRDLGYRPVVSIEEGLSRLEKWLCDPDLNYD